MGIVVVSGNGKLAVDATDMAILRDLAQAGSGRFRSQKATLEAVAEGLGLHPNTVAGRVRRMQESGLLSNFTILPEPNAMGIRGGHFFATLPMGKRTDALLDDVLRMGCVFNVIETLDGWHISPVAADDVQLQTLAEAIRSRLGSEPVQWTMLTRDDWKDATPVVLEELDLAILEALLQDANASMDELAARLGMNARTVQRRHERLRESEAFRLYPSGSIMLTGLAFRFLQVGLPSAGIERSRLEAELNNLLPNAFIRQVIARGMQFVLYGEEQGELQLLVERAATLPGVSITFNRQWRRHVFSPYYATQMAEILRSKQPTKLSSATA